MIDGIMQTISTHTDSVEIQTETATMVDFEVQVNSFSAAETTEM